NGNVVVVNVTYRLGVFGGFELSGLGAGFDDNLALRDQVAALRWVRDNIAAFGGDPGRVTVFGESAGATSVLALLASPAARGLFHRAIAQSPALPLIADADLRAGRAARFVERLGVGVDDIRELPQRALRRAAGLVQLDSIADSPALAYGLTHGVDLLPRHPIAAARAGTVHPVPLIIGTNSDEASMFAWGRPPAPAPGRGARAGAGAPGPADHGPQQGWALDVRRGRPPVAPHPPEPGGALLPPPRAPPPRHGAGRLPGIPAPRGGGGRGRR